MTLVFDMLHDPGKTLMGDVARHLSTGCGLATRGTIDRRVDITCTIWEV